MKLQKKYTLVELADKYNCEVKNDKSTHVDSICSLNNPEKNCLVFISDRNSVELSLNENICAVITTNEISTSINKPCIISKNPQFVFSKILNDNHDDNFSIFKLQDTSSLKGVSGQAKIAEGACIASDAQIGKNSLVYPNVTIYSNVSIGENVRIHSGAVIGSDGFGLVKDEKDLWQKVPQVGGVKIGDNVEIGANTTIDRGSIDVTCIMDNVKIDNLVHIAHNVYIGQNTAIAACVGIAGSTRIGKNCTIGGGVGVNGHIEITDEVHIHGMAMVTKSLEQSGHYASGTTIEPATSWRRNQARFKDLDNILRKLTRDKGATNE
tara:strand:+ start:1448 stop:2416 length:969 start_codon:yes stop_codon:yes gene_type:complete